MFIFQLYMEEEESAKKKRGDHPADHTPFAMKAGKGGSELLHNDEHFVSVMASVEKSLSKKDISDFMGTLTPGAQNAIYAASFVWGYENAARYLKNAMKVGEVKNAADSEERSKAVIESMQAQAEKGVEKSKDVSTSVASYYNEDMKETQAVASKSESISQKDKNEEKEKEREQQAQIPQNAHEAVGLSVVHGSATPSILYCANAQAEAEQQKQVKAIEAKRESMARLVEAKGGKAGKAEAAGSEGGEAAMDLALERRKEVADEYLRVEAKIMGAIDKLDALSGEKVNVERLSELLPDELCAYLRRNSRKFAKKAAMRKQLIKWLTASRACRKSVSLLPLDKLKKMVGLSSLFG